MTASSAPLVEASVEPGPVRWAELRAWHGGVEEADLSPDASTEAPPGVVGEVSSTAPAAAEPSKASPAADLRWPCACGSHVGFDQDACPVCGSAFLGDLRGEASGRHRVGSGGGMLAHQWSTSRTFRFVAAGAIALFIALGVPLMLALLG